MADTMRVRGQRVDRSEREAQIDADVAFQDGIRIDLKHVLDVGPQSRAAGEAIDLDLDDDDVIEFTDSDGWVDFTHAGRVAERPRARRDVAGGPIQLVDALAEPSTRRGGRDLTSISAYAARLPAVIQEQLDIIDSIAESVIDVAAHPVARAAAGHVLRWLERTVPDEEIGPEHVGKAKKFGVYGIDTSLQLAAERRLGSGDPLPEGRSLVLLHGTFSSTEGGFWPLQGTEEWERIVDDYDGQVFALEHPTLSVSPVRNALDLAVHLPDRGQIDLVSHSRGGLVGDFLSLGAAGLLDADLHHRPDAAVLEEERDLLVELAEAFEGRNTTVGGFVRVAAPARGTILASPRIDQVARFLFNVIPKSTGVLGWTVAVVKSLLLAFLDQRTDPRIIPGVEAMMPTSPWVRLLNMTGPVPDHLGVIAGDVDRSRWFKWFLEKGADLFYGEEHDYVVDTLSMYQGGQREAAGVSLHAGPDVNHFTYFTQADSRRRTEAWLRDDRGDEDLPTGFQPLDRDAPELVEASRKRRGPGDAASVIVVPDLFGTALADATSVVWPSPARLASIGVQGLDPGEWKATRTELLAATYGPLVERLATEFSVVALPYDWRESLTAPIERLVAAVGAVEVGPVHLLGHGAGGLVIRAALLAEPGLSERLGHVLLLGTPNLGSLALVRAAAGQGDLVECLAMIDPKAGRRGVAAVLRGMESLRETVPPAGHSDPEMWERAGMRWADVDDAGFGRLTDGNWPDPRPIAVAGVGHPTPSTMALDGATLTFAGHRDGDGVVTRDSAVAGSAVHYFVEASHGALPTHPAALSAYLDLLREGHTQRLDTSPPVMGDERVVLADEHDRHLYPTAGDLERAALGTARAAPASDTALIEVEVLHADLRFADHPIMVGHYAGSSLDGAERALDRALGGRLTQRDLLGTYPGAIETNAVVPGGVDGQPEQAVVIGLGEIGMLTGSRVAKSVAEAAVQLALSRLDMAAREGVPDDDGPLRIGLSTVLLGTAGASDLSIDNSVGAILEAVASANQRLADAGLRRPVRFGHVQFVELYEELAIEAVHAVHRLVERAPDSRVGADLVSAVRHLSVGEGGHSGQPPPAYHYGGWTPVIVEAPSDQPAGSDPESADAGQRGDLVFTSTGLAARADQEVHVRQRALVERLTREVIGHPDPPQQVYHTLYELLLPNHLKASVTDADNLLLVLDREASRYPWEMLAPRGLSGQPRPLSTSAGMIRRLLGPARSDRRIAGGTHALVIGDPPATPTYPALDGAKREAELVADVLGGGGYDVTARIRGHGEFRDLDVVNDLFAADYRILHVAAHGIHHADPEQGGIVVGADLVVSGATLRQMPAVPPLVFLNCCHLGQLDEDANAFPAADFAASVSEQLIRDGVRAVVAAGWAVDDLAALTFAESFYGCMLAGEAFGDAVRTAREEVAKGHPGVNTWGAYQCYGDPGFRLTSASDGSSAQRVPVSARELEEHLAWLAERAPERGASPDVVDAIRRDVEEAPEPWRSGSLSYEAARACAAHGDVEAAIEFYESALAHYDARAPIKLIEQLANLEGRHAEALARAAGGDAPPDTTITALIDRAGQRLQQLMDITATPERHRLLAAHHRRRAWIYATSPDELMASLVAARDAYQEARVAELPDVSPDHTINHGVFDVLISLVEDEPITAEHRAELLARIDAAREEAQRRIRTRPEFWNRVADPDADVLVGLLDGDLPERAAAIADSYRAAFELRSTASERASVQRHLDLLARVLDTTSHTELADACRTIGQRLREESR